MRLMMVFFVLIVFAACSDAANATGLQCDLVGKVKLLKDSDTNGVGMDVEYNNRFASCSACEEAKKQAIESPVEIYDAKKFYKSHQGIFGQNLQDALSTIPDLSQGYFKETSLGEYETVRKVSHLGCYPVNLLP